MSDDHEVSLMRMDVAFCARLLAAIEAGLESAPIGIVTTPGTQNPKYVKAATAARLLARRYLGNLSKGYTRVMKSDVFIWYAIRTEP
jgi:hypothetical protein